MKSNYLNISNILSYIKLLVTSFYLLSIIYNNYYKNKNKNKKKKNNNIINTLLYIRK